jgi:hypothetical protein
VKQRIGGNSNASSIVCYSFGNGWAHRTCGKVKRISNTLARGYVENNINKRMELIIEAWDMSKNMVCFGTRAHDFHEYLQEDLKNEQGFYFDAVLPFGVKVTSMKEFRIRHEDIHSLDRIDQLNACWKEKVRNLNGIVQECIQTISRRDKLFKKLTEIDLVSSTNEVQDPKWIFNSLFLTKQAFDDQVHIYKRLSFENFYGILEYGEDDMKTWLVSYAIKNQDIQEALHNLSINLRDLESEFFNIKIWHEINVAPMRSYIKEWFKKVVDQIINEGQSRGKP